MMGDDVNDVDERRWKVGDLAALTGLTVRTLHHFDEIGLLRPTERTDAGHRLYTADDVRRLYRILALRHLGIPLGEIAASLDGDSGDLAVAVRRQLE
jgi:DNA-binding transcriptional MerR regulator